MAYRWRTAAVCSLLAVLSANVASAEPQCEVGQFISANVAFQKGVVTGQEGERVYLHNGGDGCPSEAVCRRKAYVVVGDTVLINGTSADWACAAFVGAKGAVTGWIPKHQLALATIDRNPSLSAWMGKWRKNRNSLTIKAESDGKISVDGFALWGSGPAPNVGEVQGTTIPVGTGATVKDGPCRVTLTLADNWLIAKDNQECGGLNVSFSGIYRR